MRRFPYKLTMIGLCTVLVFSLPQMFTSTRRNQPITRFLEPIAPKT